METSFRQKLATIRVYLYNPIGELNKRWQINHKTEIESGILPPTLYEHIVESVYYHRFGLSLIPVLSITLLMFFNIGKFFGMESLLDVLFKPDDKARSTLALALLSAPMIIYTWFIRAFERSKTLIREEASLWSQELTILVNQAVDSSNKLAQRTVAVRQLQDYLSGAKWKANQAANSTAILQSFSLIIDDIERNLGDGFSLAVKGNMAQGKTDDPLLSTISIVIKGALKLKSEQRRLKVIGNDISDFNLSSLNLAGIDFSDISGRAVKFDFSQLEDSILQNSDFQNAHFQSSNLKSSNLQAANLQGANLYKANLEDVDLTAAKLQGAILQKANLLEATLFETQCTGADFRGAELSFIHLTKVNLQGADLQRARFHDTTFDEVELQSANFHAAYFSWATLNSADFKNANLRGTDLTFAKLNNANLVDTDLRWADLTKAELHDALLLKSNLHGAILKEAKLCKASLIEANLQNAKLKGADLTGAELQSANLYNANLKDANLEDANLKGAYLYGADLRGVKNLTPEQLKQANYWQFAYRDDALACNEDIPVKK